MTSHQPPATSHQPPTASDLGDGLIMRFATPADAEALAQFNARIHGHDGFPEAIAAWTRDFMSESHPTGPSNTTLVEDSRTGAIVSSMCLIPQTWTYEGIPFGVGRPEAVGTDEAYRRRGLVRAQFETLHARSAELGHLVQGITGIPWYYRQFGYEYALELDAGRIAFFDNVPALKDGETEPYRPRPVTLDDIPFVAPLFDRQCARSMVACPRTPAMWRDLFTGYAPGSPLPSYFRLIESADGRPAGYMFVPPELWGPSLPVAELAVAEDRSMREVMPAVLRALKLQAQALGAEAKRDVNSLYFRLGSQHPLFDAAPDWLPKTRPAYGWYIRVPDLPAFVRHIAPALEARLAASPLAGHTGQLRLTEYTRGLRLVFERGRLVEVEQRTPPNFDAEDAGFPPHTFLQLLFGFRSLAELRTAFPDCWADDDDAALLNALFPRRFSNVVPM